MYCAGSWSHQKVVLILLDSVHEGILLYMRKRGSWNRKWRLRLRAFRFLEWRKTEEVQFIGWIQEQFQEVTWNNVETVEVHDVTMMHVFGSWETAKKGQDGQRSFVQ